jgi:hypothetical protein
LGTDSKGEDLWVRSNRDFDRLADVDAYIRTFRSWINGVQKRVDARRTTLKTAEIMFTRSALVRGMKCRDSCYSASRESVCLPYEQVDIVVKVLDATLRSLAFALNNRPIGNFPPGWHGSENQARRAHAARARRRDLADALGGLRDRPPAFAFDVHLDVESLRCCATLNASSASMSDVVDPTAHISCLIDFDRFTSVAPPNVRTSLSRRVLSLSSVQQESSTSIGGPVTFLHDRALPSNQIHHTHWFGFGPKC